MLKAYNLQELQGYSNKVVHNLILSKIHSENSKEHKILSISNDIRLINDRTILNKVLRQLDFNNLLKQPNIDVEKFKKSIPLKKYSEKEQTVFEAVYYSLFFKHTINTLSFASITGELLPELIVKIRRKQIFHNLDYILDYWKKRTTLFYIDYAEKLPSNEKEKFLLMMKNSASKSDYLNSTDTYLNEIKIIKEHLSTNNSKKNSTKDYRNAIWFKVGICFANGKAQELYNKYKLDKGHFKTITLELGFKASDRPYFSETFSNQKITDKNIYSDFKKLDLIYQHSLKNNLKIVKNFFDIYTQKKPN